MHQQHSTFACTHQRRRRLLHMHAHADANARQQPRTSGSDSSLTALSSSGSPGTGGSSSPKCCAMRQAPAQKRDGVTVSSGCSTRSGSTSSGAPASRCRERHEPNKQQQQQQQQQQQPTAAAAAAAAAGQVSAEAVPFGRQHRAQRMQITANSLPGCRPQRAPLSWRQRLGISRNGSWPSSAQRMTSK